MGKAGVEADDWTLAIIVPGKGRELEYSGLLQMAVEYCALAGLPSPVSAICEEQCLPDVASSRPPSAALLVTDGSDGMADGLLQLEAHRTLLPLTVSWIDSAAIQGVVHLRRWESPSQEGLNPEELDEVAARSFAVGSCASPLPLGYVKDAKQRLVPGDPVDCELVRFIFQTYVESTLSRAEICHLLNAQRISALRTARTWGASALTSVLSDVRYAGSIRLGAWVRDNCHPALVTMGHLEAARSRLCGQLASGARSHCRPARGFTTTEATMS